MARSWDGVRAPGRDPLERQPADDRDRLERACRRILGRPAAPDEYRHGNHSSIVINPPRRWPAKVPERRRQLAWQGLCRALLSSNEFVYVD